MQYLAVRGGKPLRGSIPIHGAKNSVLPLLAATLLTPERCVITGCPEISDATAATEILRHLGCAVEWRGASVIVDASQASGNAIPSELMGKMRASVTFLGAMLSRFGWGRLSAPGGCRLGVRPINYHVAALEALGVKWDGESEDWRCRWEARFGGEVTLPFPSVGATENLLLASVSVPGAVTVHNAAREPEITDLCGFLSAMGAEISGVGTADLIIRGGKPLHGAVWHVMPDRMETASYLAMAAACGGDVALTQTDPMLLIPVLDALRSAGCRIETTGKTIRLLRDRPLRAIGTVATAPYPGFPTDAQAPLMAAMLLAEGETRLIETVFSDRFSHVPELRKFGGAIETDGNCAIVTGVRRLTAASAEATDLRGGMAAVIAALCAEGESRIYGLELIGRGYAQWIEYLGLLGADVSLQEE